MIRLGSRKAFGFSVTVWRQTDQKHPQSDLPSPFGQKRAVETDDSRVTEPILINDPSHREARHTKPRFPI
jgi:hypothetical protein